MPDLKYLVPIGYIPRAPEMPDIPVWYETPNGDLIVGWEQDLHTVRKAQVKVVLVGLPPQP